MFEKYNWKIEKGIALSETSLTRVEIDIKDGGRIVSIYDKRHRQEMIWTNIYTKSISRHYGDNYDNTSNGGVEEAFPTVQPCRIEDKEFPFFGEVWNESWKASLEEDGKVLCLQRFSPIVHSSVEKRIYFESEKQVVVDYVLKNLAGESIDYIFGVHPSLVIEEGAHILRPEMKEMVEYLTPKGIEVKEEILRIVPAADVNHCYNIVQYPTLEGAYGVYHPKTHSGIQVVFDKKFFPALSLWFIYGGWRGLYCLMSEFFTYYPAELSLALENKTANRLMEYEECKTSVKYVLTEGND